MKKKYIVIILAALLVIIGIISIIIYNNVIENEKKYEVEQIKECKYFILKQNELNGVIDIQGNTIIPVEYDKIIIPNPQRPIFICYKEENSTVLNENNKQIFTEYENIEPIKLKNISSEFMYEKTVLTYLKDGKYGLINLEGEKITNPQYDEITALPYKEGELLVKKDGKNGVINIKGKELVKCNYEQIEVDGYYTYENKYRYSGYIVSIKTEDGYRYGYINYKGNEILKNEYNQLSRITQIEDNENVYTICAINGQYGVYRNDKKIINNEYQSISYNEENKVYVVEKSKKYGAINEKGRQIIPIEYNQIDINGIYLYAQNDQETIVYDVKGTKADIGTHITILNTSNEKYKIKINDENGTKYSVIGEDGKEIIEEKYNYIEYLYENYFIVSNEESKVGIIDDKQKEKISIENDSIQQISNTNIIQVNISQNKTIKLYNKQIEQICEMQNAKIEKNEDYIKIYNEQEIKYFDKDGKELTSTQIFGKNKLFSKIENGKWGYVDKNGTNIVKCIYDKVTEFNKYGYASIKKDGKWGAINDKGQVVVEPTYEFEEEIEPTFIKNYYQVVYGFGEIYYTDNNP